MKRMMAAVLLAGVMASNAIASDWLFTPKFSTCMDQSGGVTGAMLSCIRAETAIQDARLNTAYQAFREQLSEARRLELRTVQRLWIKYRDANCGFYADPEGGSLATVMSNDCVLQETASRAIELERFILAY